MDYGIWSEDFTVVLSDDKNESRLIIPDIYLNDILSELSKNGFKYQNKTIGIKGTKKLRDIYNIDLDVKKNDLKVIEIIESVLSSKNIEFKKNISTSDDKELEINYILNNVNIWKN